MWAGVLESWWPSAGGMLAHTSTGVELLETVFFLRSHSPGQRKQAEQGDCTVWGNWEGNCSSGVVCASRVF